MLCLADVAEILQGYVKLTEFLGQTLGPDYEVVLHDLTVPNHSIIAIVNGHISGRKLGAPLTNMGLSILRDKSYEGKEYRTNDYGLSASGKGLRSNTFFIKYEGKLIGMLCINFDDSRYQTMSDHVMALAHPQHFLDKISQQISTPDKQANSKADVNSTADRVTEKYNSSSDAVIKDAIQRELDRLGISADRLTADERMQIIATLEEEGIFLLKGVVKDVAQELRCSQASVYRYMSQLKIGNIG